MKKSIIKLVLIFLCSLLLVLLDMILVDKLAKNKLGLIEVYVAKHDISSRKEITAEDVGKIYVPNIYVNDNAYTDIDDIVGKYTDIQGKIPKGSLFYKSMLYNKEELSDYPSLELLENQVAYSLACDILSLQGNSIVKDQRVDIYVTLTKNFDIPFVDKLVSDARVIAIKDNKGYDIDHPKSTGIPYIIILALNDNSIEYLAKAEKVGSIKLIASSNSYSDLEASLNENSMLLTYLN